MREKKGKERKKTTKAWVRNCADTFCCLSGGSSGSEFAEETKGLTSVSRLISSP